MLEAIIARNPTEKTYVEDVFSTWLYTGNGSTQTITNGIDLAGKGGLVWFKARTGGNIDHVLYDTARTTNARLSTNTTAAQTTQYPEFTSFNSNGFTFYNNIDGGYINQNGVLHASWTFRKAPKFFDVVTWTANGSAQNINHNLGIQPGMIIVKATSGTSNWFVWHLGSGVATSRSGLSLNTTNASAYSFDVSSSITSTSFNTLYINDHAANTPTNNGVTYVAYLFAHDTTADGVIQCGSFTTDSNFGTATVNLGWEPQFILMKNITSVQNWRMADVMRGMVVTDKDATLAPNATSAEVVNTSFANPTATGFVAEGQAVNSNYIYVAIRRGPMRVPTDATKVFKPVTTTGASPNTLLYNTGFPVDAFFEGWRDGNAVNSVNCSRLFGDYKYLTTSSTAAEASDGGYRAFDSNNGVLTKLTASLNSIGWNFRRAPGFFDVVCYTGTGSARTVSHNLGVAPELIIVKKRNTVYDWCVWHKDLTNTQYNLYLNSTLQSTQSQEFTTNSATPTATTFPVQQGGFLNSNGDTYVAYLFATCSGVSKVGSYTGNDSSLNIDCGFTNGARFVLIKRTDSPGGNWYVWDTARGIVSANDPHLSLNSTAAEVTTNDTIDPLSTGFTVNQLAATNINVSSATYIYLAIA